MLRSVFGEPRRAETGVLRDANRAIKKYLAYLSKKRPRHTQAHLKALRLELLSQGFVRALDELEQSVYCAGKYGAKVGKTFVEDMTTEERDIYHLHIYYYKNGFIRLFSVLDKVGYFMNELFDLKTEQVKSRFSYFTVLRTMHQRGIEPQLEQFLYDLKQKYKPNMDRLRNQRNMEIHALNADLLDDMMKTKEARHIQEKKTHVEAIQDNMNDLTIAFEVTCKVIAAVFTYIVAQDKGRSRR